jgi:AcrR family transcriptional regulator
MTQGFEITPRKRPTQARAQATFEALVEACARLLPELGYERLTTNAVAERAGVGIGSLYEYFPGKDALIALVVERLVERVMGRLGQELEAILAARADGAPERGNEEVERWIARVYATVETERPLVAVLVQQVPYLRQLNAVRDLPATLLAFSERARSAAGVELRQPSAALLLINNLVATTIMQVVLGPGEGASRDVLDAAHGGVSKAELIEMLSAHVSELLASGAPSPREPS